ncbi:hypothetical protein [Sphingobacterium kyonggiense]
MPITTIRLKESVLNHLKDDNKIKTMLSFNLNKSYPTITKWIREDSDQLTLASALKTISEYLDIPVDELTECRNIN